MYKVFDKNLRKTIKKFQTKQEAEEYVNTLLKQNNKEIELYFREYNKIITDEFRKNISEQYCSMYPKPAYDNNAAEKLMNDGLIEEMCLNLANEVHNNHTWHKNLHNFCEEKIEEKLKNENFNLDRPKNIELKIIKRNK
jgi:hypothetical protein